ncbi:MULTISPECIES: helix-turn-helix domain-containing protein [Enterobacteriaceae]|uniref:helix-turn-helix domain-containing protein n=2 Tax=Enterobacteriaceae TaxID=543 RepID=UPI00097681B1|nr:MULTISPECIES: helix-turn-helix transcriptional regulator [Enterobacteriaceae]MBT2078643.1 helix-turn-helix transcriptional regulator [Enterobacter hormaechei subsp. xiangfangensis]EHO0059162.1 helix-turn-helix transcriptional regulator [Escherichia coli]EIJ1664125.1 helix-turn-helix transcriptional regulator [Escherichia coli]EKF1146725.1 helix-turn-helix transcriptional regulator [Escherichia coli]ELY2624592.1 helix-turn-helix transcriptional regulator [Cronobacter sakazakii]
MSMSARQNFARNLRKIRQSQGISQEKLADLCDLHRTYVSSVERGERNIAVDNMERLAIALGVDIRELLEPND